MDDLNPLGLSPEANPYRPAEAVAAGSPQASGIGSGLFLLGVLLGIPVLLILGVAAVTTTNAPAWLGTVGVAAMFVAAVGLLSVPLLRFYWQYQQLGYLHTLREPGAWRAGILALGIVPGISLLVPFLFQSHMTDTCLQLIRARVPARVALRHRVRPVRVWWFLALSAPVLAMGSLVLAKQGASAGSIVLGLLAFLTWMLEYVSQALVVVGAILDQRALASIAISADS